MKLTVLYFAQLGDRAGRRSETVDADVATASELFAVVSARHHLGLSPAQLRVAVNESYAEWDAALADGDTVAFIPPVAGG